MSYPHLRVYGVRNPRSPTGLHRNWGHPAVIAEQIDTGLDAFPLRQSRPIALVYVPRRKPIFEVTAANLARIARAAARAGSTPAPYSRSA